MTTANPFSHFGRAAVLLAVCLLVPACEKSKVTQANFDKIKDGMTLPEVQALLGSGTKDEGGDGGNVAGQFGIDVSAPMPRNVGDTYVWESGSQKITVVFANGKVVSKTQKGL